jgi:hypothetical protein
MEARIKADSRLKVVRAFAGTAEYTRREWLPVPAGFEAEAERHEHLETRQTGGPIKAGRPFLVSRGGAVPFIPDAEPLPPSEPVEAAASELPDADAAAEPSALDELTVAELRELAKERDIAYSGLRKDELIEALSQ